MPVRPLPLLRRRRARPRARHRHPRISCCGPCRTGNLRRSHSRGADGRRVPGSRACLGRRCHLRRPPVARRGGHRHCGLSVPAVLRRGQAPGRGRPAPPLAACRPHHRRGRAALRLPRECRPSSPPRLPRSRRQDWSAWATALRQASSRRRKSARPTSASGCSSSPSARGTSWPTPRACSGTRSSGGNRTEMLRLWPTPRASANENRQTKPTPSQEAGQHGMNLATTAAMWPTPQTDSFRSRGGERKRRKGSGRHGAGLADADGERRLQAERGQPQDGRSDPCQPHVDDADGAGSQGRGDDTWRTRR